MSKFEPPMVQVYLMTLDALDSECAVFSLGSGWEVIDPDAAKVRFTLPRGTWEALGSPTHLTSTIHPSVPGYYSELDFVPLPK